MKRSDGSAWVAFAITSLLAVSAIAAVFATRAYANTATIKLGNASATASDATGPEIAGGAMDHAKAFRKLSNLTGATGTYLGDSTTLTILNQLTLDVSKSSFPAPPGQQKQVYTGKYRLTRTAPNGTKTTADINSTTTLTYPPVANAAISATVVGKIIGGAQPKLPANLSGTFKSALPLRYTDPVQFSVQSIVMVFTDAGGAGH